MSACCQCHKPVICEKVKEPNRRTGKTPPPDYYCATCGLWMDPKYMAKLPNAQTAPWFKPPQKWKF